MATARVAFGVLAATISAVPRPSETKKAHSWETPRSFGLTAAIASEAASIASVAAPLAATLAAVARSPTASRAAPARSPIRSAPLRRSSTMDQGYPPNLNAKPSPFSRNAAASRVVKMWRRGIRKESCKEIHGQSGLKAFVPSGS